MPYQYTPEGEALLAEVKQFMDDHIYPNEAEYLEQVRGGRPRRPPADHGEAQGRRTRAWAVEPVPAAPRAGRAGHEALQPRLRADLRGARQGHVLVGGAELRGARHREHGDPQHVRVRDRQAGLAGAAAGG